MYVTSFNIFAATDEENTVVILTLNDEKVEANQSQWLANHHTAKLVSRWWSWDFNPDSQTPKPTPLITTWGWIKTQPVNPELVLVQIANLPKVAFSIYILISGGRSEILLMGFNGIKSSTPSNHYNNKQMDTISRTTTIWGIIISLERRLKQLHCLFLSHQERLFLKPYCQELIT